MPHANAACSYYRLLHASSLHDNRFRFHDDHLTGIYAVRLLEQLLPRQSLHLSEN